MSQALRGIDSLRAFLAALGVDPDAVMVQRAVVVLDCHNPACVYLKTLAPAELPGVLLTGVVRVVKDVRVSDDAVVVEEWPQ